MTDRSVEDKHPLEWQHVSIDEAQDEIEERRDHVRDMAGSRELDSHTNRQMYLEGYYHALEWAATEVEGIHRIKPGMGETAWDVRDISHERVQNLFKTLISEALNDNWGNVRVNLDKLDDALEEAQADDEDEGGQEAEA